MTRLVLALSLVAFAAATLAAAPPAKRPTITHPVPPMPPIHRPI
jgi:hypothetical protein